MNLRITKRIALLVLLSLPLNLLLFSPVSSGIQNKDTHPATVTDISDRAYEPAVVKLLDGAETSIVMSMYLISSLKSGPVKYLLRDLSEALGRGVTVEIYINTRSNIKQEPDRFL